MIEIPIGAWKIEKLDASPSAHLIRQVTTEPRSSFMATLLVQIYSATLVHSATLHVITLHQRQAILLHHITLKCRKTKLQITGSAGLAYNALGIVGSIKVDSAGLWQTINYPFSYNYAMILPIRMKTRSSMFLKEKPTNFWGGSESAMSSDIWSREADIVR